MVDEPEGQRLSVDEICQYPGASSDTVCRWVGRSAMFSRRMGRERKLKRDQVDAWIEANGAADNPHEESPEGRAK